MVADLAALMIAKGNGCCSNNALKQRFRKMFGLQILEVYKMALA